MPGEGIAGMNSGVSWNPGTAVYQVGHSTSLCFSLFFYKTGE